ncbi:MAG TPA: response regulator [Acidimicrobiales bacterium]|nr:response regulator [Acidimicrobiales bacterium]
MTPTPRRRPNTGQRLVVVDDNADYRLLVRYALEGSDLEVVGEAATPAEGIRLVRDLQPDGVLLDIVHRDDEGLMAVRDLQEAAPDTTVIAVASYAQHELWGRSSHLGAVAYLPKSTPATKLCRELVRILESDHHADDVIRTATERFPADLKSARTARRFVAGVLDAWGLDALQDGAALLVSELVTNAVVHAHSTVELAVHLRPERIRIEVVDTARDHVRRRDAKDDEQSGRGMALIEALAVAWGIDTLLSGKSVWFEMERAGSSRGPGVPSGDGAGPAGASG